MPRLNLANLRQRNLGLLQFNAVKETVFGLIAGGYSYRSIYESLRNAGAYTGSYRRFCEYLQAERQTPKTEIGIEQSPNAAGTNRTN